MSQTSVHGVFYPDLSQAYNMVRVIDARGEGGRTPHDIWAI